MIYCLLPPLFNFFLAECQRILFWSKTSKIGACSGFLEVKNRSWSIAHTRVPDIRKFPLGQIPANVTLNIELFILVIHFDHFLKWCQQREFLPKVEAGFVLSYPWSRIRVDRFCESNLSMSLSQIHFTL